MKRGYIQSTIFLIIIIAVVVSLVFIFGFRSLQIFKGRTTQIQSIEFEQNFKAAVSSTLKARLTKNLNFEIPGAVKICLIDLETAPLSSDSLLSQYPLIMDSVRSGVKKNVFLFDREDSVKSFYAPYMKPFKSIDPYYNCVDIPDNKISLTFEGRRRHTRVTTNMVSSILIPEQLLEKTELVSIDGLAKLTIKEGTTVLDSENNSVKQISVKPIDHDDFPTKGAFEVAGLMYDFSEAYFQNPMFDFPASITIKYYPNEVDPSEVEIRFYNGISWVSIQSLPGTLGMATIDRQNNQIEYPIQSTGVQ